MKNALLSVVSFCLSVYALTSGATSLPSGYSAVPYLQSDGTAYIDTGYCPNKATKLEATFDVKDMSGDHYLFGSSDNPPTANRGLWVETFGNDGGYVGIFGVGYIGKSSGTLGLSMAEYKSCSFAYADGKMEFTNTTDDKTAVYDATSAFAAVPAYQSQTSFAIFTRQHADGSVKAQNDTLRIRSFKIYEDEMLVRDLLPAYDESGRRLGLYDLVSGVFYANAASSGAFTTEITGYHKRLSYLGGTGIPYIDTGYVFKTRPRVECGMYLNCGSDSDIMGSPTSKAGCFIVDYADGGKMLYYRYGNTSANASMTVNYGTNLQGKWVDAVFDTAVTHNSVTVGTAVASYSFSQNDQTFWIFRGRYTNMKVRFSYLRAYDGDVLVRDFIPAEVGGEVGLWDRLTQRLYTNATTGEFETGVAIPAQPGDFSILQVEGSPANLGTVSPAYGRVAATPGETATATAVAPESTDKERVSLAGWEVYWDDELQASGTTSPATFAYGDGTTTLKWLWSGEFYVTFAAGTHGTVTNTSAWYASGETVSVLAVPDANCEFVCWKGVPEGQEKLNPLPLVVDGARTVEAVFSSVDAMRLEYIGSTGLQQYIDTGYVFTNRPAVVARMMMMDTTDKDFLGMSAQAADCFIVDYADGNGTLYYRYAASDYTSAGYANSSGKLLGKWFDCAWSNIVWHGDYKILDLSNNGYTGKFATNKQVFKLFGGRTYGKVRFGAVKMYDGETLVRDYIPAKLGGVAGMWDRKERKFYRCAQNGTLFEEGPVVASEPGDFAVTHSVTADEGGTATISDPEAELGTSVTLTATPAAGYAFAGWMGNIPAAYAASATATFVVTEPLVVKAAFAADVPYVVDPSGGGDFTTLDEAVAALAGKAGTLQVKAGVYTVTNTLALTGGLAMVPESGRLGDVTVAAGATDKFTLVELSHPLARLSNLVISNGYTASSQKGGNVTMSAGIVENCLITAGRMRGDSGTVPAAAGVYMTGGALRNSLVRGNYTVGDNGCALGVYAKGVDTLVENCDVSCNTNLMNYRVEYLVRSGGIRVDGGLVRNCTITNNVNIGHSNLYVTDGGRVEDTLVADNVGGFYFDELSGGGYVPKGGSATFVRTTFARNSGYGIGGLYVGGSVTLTGVRAYGNTSVVGGNDGNMDVRGCSTAGIDFTDPGETPVERVADVHVPADTTDIREAVRRCADGGTVHVAAGEHLISHEVVVDRPIRIVGAGAELTTLTRDPSVPYLRLVNLRHADAAVEGLAVTGGRKLGVNCVNVFKGTLRQALVADASDEGACAVWNGGAIRDTRFTRIASSCTYSGLGAAVSVKSGAVMEDCVVEKCRQQGDNLVNVFGGRLARLTFRDNYVAGNPAACIGLNGPGVVESTLVTHNDGSWYSAAGFIVGGTGWEVRNCTVVSNLSEYAGAAVHWITNAWNNTVRQGTFVNCIFYRNHCTKDKHPEFFDVSSGNGTRNIDVTFRNCLFTTSEAAAAQGERAIDSLSGDPLFRSLARRDYRLGAGSPCRAAGYLWRGAEEPSATDIAGRPLSRAGCIDVGCHATSHGGLMMIVR